MMEVRTIEYHRSHHGGGGGLDYHNSPLIGEIPNSEYHSQVHRSIEQLRSLNERGELNGSPLDYKYTINHNNNNNTTVVELPSLSNHVLRPIQYHRQSSEEERQVQSGDTLELKTIEKQEQMDGYDSASPPRQHLMLQNLSLSSSPPEDDNVGGVDDETDEDGGSVRRKNKKKVCDFVGTNLVNTV